MAAGEEKAQGDASRVRVKTVLLLGGSIVLLRLLLLLLLLDEEGANQCV